MLTYCTAEMLAPFCRSYQRGYILGLILPCTALSAALRIAQDYPEPDRFMQGFFAATKN